MFHFIYCLSIHFFNKPSQQYQMGKMNYTFFRYLHFIYDPSLSTHSLFLIAENIHSCIRICETWNFMVLCSDIYSPLRLRKFYYVHKLNIYSSCSNNNNGIRDFLRKIFDFFLRMFLLFNNLNTQWFLHASFRRILIYINKKTLFKYLYIL